MQLRSSTPATSRRGPLATADLQGSGPARPVPGMVAQVKPERPGAKAGPRGTGLGLYWGREIVRAYDGRIGCTGSRAAEGDGGRGTGIAIALPPEPRAASPGRLAIR